MTARALTGLDVQMLDFEARPWTQAGAKESAIYLQFRLSWIQYYYRLNRLLDKPAAVQYAPRLVHRLREIRDSPDNPRRSVRGV